MSIFSFAPNRRTLDWKQIGAQVGVPRAILDTAEIEVLEQQAIESLMLQVRAFVLSDRIETQSFPVEFTRQVEDVRVTTFRMPATWWDHWKRDAAPRWLRRRLRSVRWVQSSMQTSRTPRDVQIAETVHLERDFHYPDHNLALPPEKFGRPVLYETWRGPDGY